MTPSTTECPFPERKRLHSPVEIIVRLSFALLKKCTDFYTGATGDLCIYCLHCTGNSQRLQYCLTEPHEAPQPDFHDERGECYTGCVTCRQDDPVPMQESDSALAIIPSSPIVPTTPPRIATGQTRVRRSNRPRRPATSRNQQAGINLGSGRRACTLTSLLKST
jgi:hypothetical protein